MADTDQDELSELLDAGWSIEGYTVNLMAAGAQHINNLLRYGTDLVNFWIIVSAGNEIGRGKMILAPFSPPKKRGFF